MGLSELIVGTTVLFCIIAFAICLVWCIWYLSVSIKEQGNGKWKLCVRDVTYRDGKLWFGCKVPVIGIVCKEKVSYVEKITQTAKCEPGCVVITDIGAVYCNKNVRTVLW